MRLCSAILVGGMAMKQRGAAGACRYGFWGAGTLCLTVMSSSAMATGFFLNQQSVQGLGRSDAGNAAAASDVSTVYYNPAGMPYLWRDDAAGGADTRFAIGAQLIVPRAQHLNTGSTATTPLSGGAVAYAGPNGSDPTAPTPVPNVFLAHRLSGGQGFVGVGMTSPFGLSAKFNNDWFARYDSIETSLRTVNLTAVGAYQVTPAFSIGGGLDLQYARSKQVAAVPDPLNFGGPTAATDARAESTGSAWTPGFNAGFMWQANEKTRFGMHYRSEIDHKMSGTVTTSGLTGLLAAGNGAVGATSRLKLPRVVGTGVAHRVDDRLTLYGEVDWYGWATLKELRIQYDNGAADSVRVTNYRNTFAYAIGGEYRQTARLTLRSGVQWDFTPTVDGFRDTTFPDSNRFVIAAGASYRVSRGAYFDFAVNHVSFRTATVAVQRPFFAGTALASTVNVNDVVNARINTLSVQLRQAF